MNPLISVIVPIYKVEEYLSRCVDSIINQTYKNLEIILVDDGSPDNCPKICDDYAKIDKRIKVVHKENGGLSDARNAGMKVANGEYISFIDSDDYISLDFINVLYDTIVSEDSDIVECNVAKVFDSGINNEDECCSDMLIRSFYAQDALHQLLIEGEFKQHVWNKLYRSSIVVDVPYAVGKLNEDEFWTYQVFGKAKKISKINKKMYYYYQRSDSIIGSSFNSRRLDALEAKCNRQEYIEANFSDLISVARIDFYGTCMFCYQSSIKYLSKNEKKDALKIINKYKKKCKLTFKEIMSVSSKTRKYFLFSKFSFYLCCKLKAIFNIGF